jgi:hypothetical protein
MKKIGEPLDRLGTKRRSEEARNEELKFNEFQNKKWRTHIPSYLTMFVIVNRLLNSIPKLSLSSW